MTCHPRIQPADKRIAVYNPNHHYNFNPNPNLKTVFAVRKLLPKAFFPAVLACLLTGCIIVEDFGTYWNKGFTDKCVNDIVYREMESDNEEEKAQDVLLRSVRIGGHTFLMMREHEEDKGGNLVRYIIEGGEYVTYRLNEAKRDEFLQRYPNTSIVVTQETVTIPLLNEEAAQLLAKIADDDSYWLVNTKQPYNPEQHADCIVETHHD